MTRLENRVMKIALRKTSFVDYPGKISGVLFFSACNLRCPWCHNRQLVLGTENPESLVSIDTAIAHFKKRRAVISAAVLSGGEPTIYSELPDLIRRVKELGLSVKLDTNGMEPVMLEKLFQSKSTSPDYIALDLKIAPDRYVFLSPCNQENLGEKLKLSAALIHSSGIPHEFRTLAFPRNFITTEDIESLAPLVDDSPWYFRPFRAENCLDPAWDNMEDVKAEDIESLAQKARNSGKQTICIER